ncbi:MAG: glycoside hydrolase family 3 N-terminal domain-containing protein [Cyanobacteriota bacterium]|nr:glycoside hydrolase family 3 N-terminal domain-containing protein [Cyanobacteriota bacterium]
MLGLLQLLLALALLALSVNWRSPFLPSLRFEILVLATFCCTVLIIAGVWQFQGRNFVKYLSGLTLAVSVASFAVLWGIEAEFQVTKHNVLNDEPARLESLGQHFVVGYRDFEEVRELVEKRAIAGIFITKRNIQGKTKEQIKQEIQSLQQIRDRQNLSPLWIATDQEGGIVSRLSPPLTQLPQLSTIVEEQRNPSEQKEAVIEYATIQGKELSEIGVNLNFAPVVDINKDIVNPEDRFSKIYKRAISRDRAVVARVAQWYCQTLMEYNVYCTLKHFPGLGRVEEDTHLSSAKLETPIAQLQQDDWVPFRQVLKNTPAFTMLGHAILTEVDREHPVSFSESVVTGIVRNQWQHDGILITDDFCMQAVFRSKAGLRKATIAALNGGVDLVLIAYDTDLYYPAIRATLQARARGKLDEQRLAASQKRLNLGKKDIKFGL